MTSSVKILCLIILIFTISIGASGIEQIKISQPALGETVNSPVKFVWSKVDSTIFYRFELFNRFQRIKFFNTNDTTQILKLIDGEKYIFLISAIFDSAGKIFTQDVVDFKISCQSPEIPDSLKPNQKTKLVELSPTFSYFSRCFDKIQLQISKEKTFNSIVYESDSIKKDTFHLPVSLEYNTLYYWRVRSFINDLWSDWSEIEFFQTIIENFKLQTPMLVSPYNETIVNYLCLLNFEFQSIHDAEQYVLTLTDGIEGGDSSTTISSINQISYSIVLKSNRNYYWKVKAINGKYESEWSETWSFSTKSNDIPMMLYPKSGDSVNPGNLKFLWSIYPKTKNYSIKLDLLDSNNNIRNSESSLTEDSTCSFKVFPDKHYSWTLKDAWSQCYYNLDRTDFYTKANPQGNPKNPILIYPENDDTISEPRVRFMWLKGLNTTYNYFTLSRLENGYLAEIIYYQIRLSDTIFNMDRNLLPNTQYAWKIKGCNDFDCCPENPIEYKFTTANFLSVSDSEIKQNKIYISYISDNLIISSSVSCSSELFIYDLLGRLYLRKELRLSEGENFEPIIQDLPACFICVIMSGSQQTSKLIMK